MVPAPPLVGSAGSGTRGCRAAGVFRIGDLDFQVSQKDCHWLLASCEIMDYGLAGTLCHGGNSKAWQGFRKIKDGHCSGKGQTIVSLWVLAGEESMVARSWEWGPRTDDS